MMTTTAAVTAIAAIIEEVRPSTMLKVSDEIFQRKEYFLLCFIYQLGDDRLGIHDDILGIHVLK